MTKEDINSSQKTKTISPALHKSKEPYVVGIGASAGGLAALEQFFQNVPLDSGAAYVVVQHLSPDFKSYMNELLARHTRLPIYQVEEGMEIAPNSIYLIPRRKNMILANDQFHLTDQEKTNRPDLPVDIFLNSLAKDKGPNAIAVILSGTGSDGSQGVRAISQAEGLVIVQNQASAGFDGMPFSARATGLANLVLPPEMMPSAILQYIQNPQATLTTETFRNEEAGPNDDISLIMSILRQHYNLDFSQYRPATIQRRIERRVGLTHSQTLDTYAQNLQGNRREIEALYHDLLVEVTEFFRDAQAFSELQSRVIASLISDAEPGHPIRVWVAGCATGEEAYTLAILFHEECQRQQKNIDIKIFATDVSELMLAKAGLGQYDKQRLANVPDRYMSQYFVPVNGNFQICKDIRQMIVFAQHNLLVDSPFNRLDLITCRNVLIYFQPMAQKRILTNFHFGLKQGGALFLGPSEHITELADEFEPVVQRWRIYAKRRDVRLPTLNLATPAPAIGYPTIKPATSPSHAIEKKPDWPLDFLNQYLAPSLLVDDNYQLVQTFGNGEAYVRLQGGNISLNVLKLLEGDLRTAVRAGLHRAANERGRVTYSNILWVQDDEEQRLNVTVVPVFSQAKAQHFYVITFETRQTSEAAAMEAIPLDVTEESLDHISRLESELQQAREQLKTMIEELETTNEELQAANEELMASNEELQSSNEELQSVNQELFTVNSEYQEKINELTQTTNDLHNLQRSSQVGTIFLDRALRIRDFTPAVTETFNLLRQDVGRPLAHLLYNIQLSETEMEEYVTKVLTKGETVEREIQGPTGNDYLMRILPYKADGTHKIEGVVLTFTNISVLKDTEAQLRRRERWLSAVVDASDDAIIGTDLDGTIIHWNKSAERIYGYVAEEIIGQNVRIIAPSDKQEEIEAFRARVQQGVPTHRVETTRMTKDGKRIKVAITIVPIENRQGKSIGASATIRSLD